MPREGRKKKESVSTDQTVGWIADDTQKTEEPKGEFKPKSETFADNGRDYDNDRRDDRRGGRDNFRRDDRRDDRRGGYERRDDRRGDDRRDERREYGERRDYGERRGGYERRDDRRDGRDYDRRDDRRGDDRRDFDRRDDRRGDDRRDFDRRDDRRDDRRGGRDFDNDRRGGYESRRDERRDFDRRDDRRDRRDNDPSPVLAIFGLGPDYDNDMVRGILRDEVRVDYDINVVQDRDTRKCKGFGFLNFNSVDDARMAKERIEGVLGRFENCNSLRVDYGKDRSRRY